MDYYYEFQKLVGDFNNLRIEKQLSILKGEEEDVDVCKEVIIQNPNLAPTNIIAIYINKYIYNEQELISFLKGLNINPYKMALLLDQIYVLNDKEYLKNQIINTKYKEFYSRSTDDIVYELQCNVFESLSNLEDSDYFAYSYGELGNLFDEVTLNELRIEASKIINEPDKEVGKRWFRTYTELVGACLGYEYGLDNANVITTLDLDIEIGLSVSGKNIVLINAEHMPTTFNGNEFDNVRDIDKKSGYNILTTLYHEFTHLVQDDYLYSEESKYDYRALVLAEQELLEEYYPNINLNYENYLKNPYEIDARRKGFIETYRYIDGINKETSKKYFKERIINFRKDLFYQKLRTRIIENNNTKERINIQELIDTIPKDIIARYIRKYPVLRCKYNSDGTKKSIEEVENYLNIVEKRLKSDKTGLIKRRYAFYLNVMRDYIEAYKIKRPLIMVSPKKAFEDYKSGRGK